MSTIAVIRRPLDVATIDELEKLVFIPYNSLFLNVLDLEKYYDLLTFLPWDNPCQVDMVILAAIQASGKVLIYVCQIE